MPESNIRATEQGERQLNSLDVGIIWFGAAISIGEIWGGGQSALTAIGLGAGLLAILLGRLIGNGLMAAMAKIGARSGLPTMVLSRPALGLRGSQVLSTLNVLQLIGWTGFMVFVGVTYLDALATELGLPTVAQNPAMRFLWAALLAVLCSLWAYFFTQQKIWRIIERTAGVLLLLLTVGMMVAVLHKYPLAGLLAGTGAHFLPGMDLVIVMSVSWVPLVCDYSAFASSPRAGAAGTFWGYLIGGAWMYAVGLLVAIAARSAEPDALVLSIMGSRGMSWAVLAIALVLLSTVTTTFLDIYSAVISAQNTGLRLPAKAGVLIVGLVGGALALCLDAYSYEPFLLAIGAVFLPAFVVVLADYYLLRGNPERALTVTRAWNLPGLLAWLIGFLVFDGSAGWTSIGYFAGLAGVKLVGTASPLGASLPCIGVTLLAYLLLRRLPNGRDLVAAAGV